MALVTVVGAGLGGLSTALRLSSKGYQVRILEKGDKPGGRLNIIRQDGFNFDMGPSFFSMSYEFEELFKSCGVDNPLHLEKLDPVYQIFFRNKSEPVKLFHDIALLEKEFSFEPNFRQKYEQYIRKAAEFFHDTEGPIIQQNFDSLLDYFANFFQVPLKHTPYLFRTMWEHLDNTFEHERTKVIFSLVAFFLGSTPYKTPAIYSLLNYTEMEHDGYWAVKGGMYSIVSEIVKLLESRGVEFHYNTEICSVNSLGDKVFSDRKSVV